MVGSVFDRILHSFLDELKFLVEKPIRLFCLDILCFVNGDVSRQLKRTKEYGRYKGLDSLKEEPFLVLGPLYHIGKWYPLQ